MSREIKKSVTLKQMLAIDSRGANLRVVRTVNATTPFIGVCLTREEVNTLINQGVKVTIK